MELQDRLLLSFISVLLATFVAETSLLNLLP
jgi:hypothetical protein